MQSGVLPWHIILLRGGPAGWRLGCETESYHCFNATSQSTHAKLRKVLTQPGFEPGTFHFRGGCSNHWATELGWSTNVKSAYGMMALALMTYNCLPCHYWQVTPSFTRTCMAIAWVNEIRFQIGFKYPSKNTINTKTGRNAIRGCCPGILFYCRARQSHTIALTLCIVPQCHTSINPCHTLKSYDPAGIWTRDLPLSRRML